MVRRGGANERNGGEVADFSQIWKAVGDLVTADATLVGLLAGGVYYAEQPAPQSPTFPLLRMAVLDDGPNTGLTGLGDYSPRVQVDVFGPDPAVNDRVLRLLDTLLTIPRSRRAGLTTDDYTVRGMYRTSGVRFGTPYRTTDGLPVSQLSTEWQLKVTTNGD